MADKIIRIESLVKRFGDLAAVNNVTLDVKKGEIFGLLGPNGAGKTTIINMLLSLLIPTSGKISIEGLDILRHREEIKQMIGLMTQETVVEQDLTATQNLDIFARLYHIPDNEIPKRIKEALRESDLTNFANAKAGTFSGGMQRRLSLVKAMIQEPKILILDEPTTGLDVQNRVSMWARIKGLNSSGTTIIMTTQYLEEADELCDRIAIIDHGKIIAIGTPSELKGLAGSGNVLEIVAQAADVDRVARMLKSKFDIAANVKGDRITASLGGRHRSTFAQIAARLEREKIYPLSMSTHLPTLDDVFIKFTGAGLRDATGEGTSQFGRLRIMK
jgi:ABC-2 type transport system ATP-binding protein